MSLTVFYTHTHSFINITIRAQIQDPGFFGLFSASIQSLAENLMSVSRKIDGPPKINGSNSGVNFFPYSTFN